MSGKYNLSVLFLGLIPWLTSQGQQKYLFQEPKMGSPFTIIIYGDDSAKAAEAARAAFLKVDTLNYYFSDYLDNSELSKLSRSSGSGKYVPVSAELFDLLKRSKEASRLSQGSFDITIGPLVKLWRRARKEKTFPRSDSLKAALAFTGYRHILLRTKQQAVKLDMPGMQLDLGGIAKGYAATEALNVLRTKGFPCAMVNAGGDIAAGAPPPGRKGWRIGIGIPEKTDGYLPETVSLKYRAVATSGDVYQRLSWQGKQYSHIIDPKTGLGITTPRNVTVIATDGATADWLASACSILPVKKALRLVHKLPHTELYIVEKRSDTLYRIASPGFQDFNP